MKRKAKFQVGQVVLYKLDSTYVRISRDSDDAGHYFFSGHHKDTWGHVSEFRPLTKRERGGK